MQPGSSGKPCHGSPHIGSIVIHIKIFERIAVVMPEAGIRFIANNKTNTGLPNRSREVGLLLPGIVYLIVLPHIFKERVNLVPTGTHIPFGVNRKTNGRITWCSRKICFLCPVVCCGIILPEIAFKIINGVAIRTNANISLVTNRKNAVAASRSAGKI